MMRGRDSAAFVAAAAALFALFLAKGALLTAPAPATRDFDADRAFARLVRILGDERPHTVDSAAGDALRDRLVGEIRAIGYEPDIRDDFVCRDAPNWRTIACARVRNLVFRAGPTGGEAILIASHYDSVPAGPGAADDGAGLAAALEIAAILKQRRPVKAVLFLITDGEEAGLLGAASFMRRDPLAADISAVVNMEARGVAGPAILFETSAPNGRDLQAFALAARRPVGNSLATSIYRLMPNDTDMSEFLGRGYDAANLAFIGRPQFYHTPKDDLSSLDRRSLAHLGATALSTLDGYLRADFPRVERDYAFADVFARTLVVLPHWATALLCAFGLGAAVFAVVRDKPERRWRVIVAPPLAVAAATGLAAAALALIAAIRPEPAYWSAVPAAAAAVCYLAALLGAAVAVGFAADGRSLLAAAWLWFSAAGLAAWAALPGAAIFFAAPAALFGCAAVASAGAPRLFGHFSWLGAAAAFALFLPGLAFAETALGFGPGWAFAAAAALLALLALPLVPPPREARLLPAAALAAAFAGAIVLALTVDAYSPQAPRPLNIQHVVSGGESFLALSPPHEEAPPSLRAAAAFARRPIDGLTGERPAAPAPPHDGAPVAVDILSAEARDGARALSLRVSADGADEILLAAPAAAGLRRVEIGADAIALAAPAERTIRCYGRACAAFEMKLLVGAEPAEWRLIAKRYGAGPNAAALAAARPDWTIPIQDGDVRLTVSRARL
jgi:hypothetical protein